MSQSHERQFQKGREDLIVEGFFGKTDSDPQYSVPDTAGLVYLLQE